MVPLLSRMATTVIAVTVAVAVGMEKMELMEFQRTRCF